MDLKLIVLAGAKQGTEIPLKKDKFVIGRAKEANLRAGSEAISRQHCVFRQREKGWTVRDLGSRNGTYVNDQRIEVETPLEPGNELRVGPLRFRVAPATKPVANKAATQPESSVVPKPHDIKRGKQSPVRNVADVAERSAGSSHGVTSEDDISDWLIGASNVLDEAMMKETRTIRMEETTAIGRSPARPEADAKSPQSIDKKDDKEGDSVEETDESSAEVIADESPSAAGDPATSSSAGKSGWGWLKFGKGSPKKKVGKLPPRPTESSKDSREAAADILREMTRRR